MIFNFTPYYLHYSLCICLFLVVIFMFLIKLKDIKASSHLKKNQHQNKIFNVQKFGNYLYGDITPIDGKGKDIKVIVVPTNLRNPSDIDVNSSRVRLAYRNHYNFKMGIKHVFVVLFHYNLSVHGKTHTVEMAHGVIDVMSCNEAILRKTFDTSIENFCQIRWVQGDKIYRIHQVTVFLYDI